MPEQLASGKTKTIWDAGDGQVIVESRDDITAGDGASHDVLEGKSVLATETTRNVFRLLEKEGIPTHFVGEAAEENANPRVFRAQRVNMIPLELVVRRIATGSYLKRRPDVAEGTVFPQLIVEFFEKDDTNNDPLLVFDFASKRLLRYAANKPLSEGFIDEESLDESKFFDLDGLMGLELIEMTERVFAVLERAWAGLNIALVDLKIECGMTVPASGPPELVVADVIDNDSWRIWPGGDKKQMLDKQVYRDLAEVEDPAARAKEFGRIREDYAQVAAMTSHFAM